MLKKIILTLVKRVKKTLFETIVIGERDGAQLQVQGGSRGFAAEEQSEGSVDGKLLGDIKAGRFFFFFLIYFWVHWVFVAAHGLSLVAASGGYSSLQCAGFLLRWLLLLQSMGSRHTGFSSCSTQAQ